MNISDSNNQPSHATENTFTNEPTDDYHHNENSSWKHPSNHDARMPVTHGGTVFYVPPSAVTVPAPFPTNDQPSSSFPSATAAPFILSGSSAVLQSNPTHFSFQDVAHLLASTKKDHLPEWKLSEYNGDPIHWHEWFGQFKSAIDIAPLRDDDKLTYLKTLVTGKAKVAIAEFSYCGAMYKHGLKTLEQKFGQSQAVVTAYLDKLANVPPVKKHNSESIISYSALALWLGYSVRLIMSKTYFAHLYWVK